MTNACAEGLKQCGLVILQKAYFIEIPNGIDEKRGVQ